MRLAVLLTLLAFSCVSLNYASTYETKSCLDDEIISYKDFVIWVGAGRPEPFNKDSMRESQKQNFETIGLKEMEEAASIEEVTSIENSYIQSTLANYHFNHSKCFRKAIYWATQSANVGNLEGMYVLEQAFLQGKGVLQDNTEAVKWSIVMSVLGKETAHKMVGEIRARCPNIYKDASHRASIWIKAHPELFCSP